MAKKIDIPKDNNIINIPLEEAMPDNYLPYAVEVAKERALPDVRDGLKPVHRRILYGAYMLKAFPDKPYYKSARIVGDILGKYHPHGDSSVYEAMVILAQNFSTRYPLIDGHGNWGSQDGDGAAAMRYTEARLTPMAMEMLKDMDKNVVDMMDNYSSSELEPRVLPARYPNLLVNGAFGIAVGLATNIPPHNLNEVIDGTLKYIDNNEITTAELMNYIKGPDLPTGGILIGRESLLSAYEKGEGKVTLRAKTSIEMLENGRYGIVITEFPYRKNKAKLLQSISEMTGDKRHQKALESITDIRDESDRTGIRSVIEFKKVTTKDEVEKVLKYIFKKTELQSNISFNMVALSEGKPLTMGLKTIIKFYVQHQKEVVKRRAARELEIAEKRFHIVEGLIKAIDVLDEIIVTIRASKSKKDSINNLVEKFEFTEIQAEAIVELMLYRLTGLEIKIFLKEHKELSKLIKKLKNILENESVLLAVVKSELSDVKEKYGDSRRTEIVEDEAEAKIDIEEFIVIEDTVVTMSNEGFIKRISQKTYLRSNTNVEDIEYRDGDTNKYLFNSNTKDIVMFFTSDGNMYQLKGDAIPEYKWKEKGEKIDTIIKGLDLNKERIIGVFSVGDINCDQDFLLITDRGFIKRTSVPNFSSNYSRIMALKLKGNEKLNFVKLLSKDEDFKSIHVQTVNGLSFIVKNPCLKAVDRNILGTKLFNFSKNDEIKDIELINQYNNDTFYVSINEKGMLKANGRATNKSKLGTHFKECKTDSEDTILVFTNTGKVLSLYSCLLQNIIEEGFNLDNINNEFNKETEKILNIISIKDYNNDIFFFTKNGFVKKMKMDEFKGDYTSCTVYKFRSENDEIINLEFLSNESEGEVILITKKGMSIRFNSSLINYMGKVASGVTGVSLGEEDDVVYGFLYKGQYEEITLKSKDKEIKTVKIDEIKQQNRAGRGKNIMITALDDFIKEIKLK
ncbi:DNA topoisomerase IV subunit A [Clostridium akagii]|uniref:DNA topoisomerase IV subunit A n=1 Tax=Clostridium akagii TaxID=91623 RepID=UPI00047C1FA2|nr:DNA topoisomerase IV subunit A [Clostridium akagii]